MDSAPQLDEILGMGFWICPVRRDPGRPSRASDQAMADPAPPVLAGVVVLARPAEGGDDVAQVGPAGGADALPKKKPRPSASASRLTQEQILAHADLICALPGGNRYDVPAWTYRQATAHVVGHYLEDARVQPQHFAGVCVHEELVQAREVVQLDRAVG